VEQSIGSRDIEDMGGIMYRMPFTTIITMLGMVSMLMPPFGMLLGKWIAMEASVGSPLILILTIVGSAFTVMFWAKWLGRIQTVSYHPRYKMETIPATMRWTLLLMVVATVVAGAGSVEIFRVFIVPLAAAAYGGLFAAASPAMDILRQTGRQVVWPLLVLPGLALVGAYVTYRRFKPANVRLPFLCGENVEDAIPHYTFRSIADQAETAWAASYYLRDVVTEGRLTFWSNLLAAVILLAMFGVISPL
jgi:ech hydrogenase subunit A